MLTGIGRWLRQQREARGWARREMANRLIQAAQAAGDATVPSIEHLETYIRRWESGRHGPTERYVLYYCTVFSIRPSQFGTAPLPPPKTLAPAPGTPSQSRGARPVPVAPAMLDLSGRHPAVAGFVAHHVIAGADVENIAVGQDVVTAAHYATDLAEQAEQHRVGETTTEQLHADVRRLARLSDTSEPSAGFADMRRIRDRTARLLARGIRPCEQADVYFLLGCLHGLMGNIAVRLGYPDPAEQLIRAGWAHADLIGHSPLRAQLRTLMSALMYWRGRYAEARELALDGLRYVPEGWPGACLHLQLARSAARLGDTEAAQQAVRDADEIRNQEHTDELVQMGGQFALSRASHHRLAGAALSGIEDAGEEAGKELERAIELYDEGPAEDEDHWYAGKPLASLDLAMVRLRSGALDAAAAALDPALSLPAMLRVAQVTTRLAAVRDELVAPIYRRSAQARELAEQIEEFSRETIIARLHTLHDDRS
ncbi:MAG: helix-turn-helix transcriptional regulator [Streptosporangiaceae bacterium]|nr:helix-turn-helix transcriptional regulator [Streptosporangiaceae bacterium]